MTRGQPGFFDLDERYERLSAVGNLLEKLNAVIPWPVFEKPLANPRAQKRNRSHTVERGYKDDRLLEATLVDHCRNPGKRQRKGVLPETCHAR